MFAGDELAQHIVNSAGNQNPVCHDVGKLGGRAGEEFRGELEDLLEVPTTTIDYKKAWTVSGSKWSVGGKSRSCYFLRVIIPQNFTMTIFPILRLSKELAIDCMLCLTETGGSVANV